jgi:hypothetical protein
VNIIGKQIHFLTSFAEKLTPQSQEDSFSKCKFIFLRNSKIGIDNTRFILKGDEINMAAKKKALVEIIYKEIKKERDILS